MKEHHSIAFEQTDGERAMNLPFKTLDDVELEGKRILIRVDMNCSLDPETKKIINDSRIRAMTPTLHELERSRVVLMAHQGRPGSDDFISLEQHTEILRQLGFNAHFVDDIFGEKAKKAIETVKVGEILVLQNVRMFDGEMRKGPIEEVAREPIVQELYPFFDLFVNDAFGAAHRSQPSIVGFTTVLPSVAGRVMEKEVRTLTEILSTDKHPWILVLGGSKVPDKVMMIKKLLEIGRADNVLLGGLIGTLFLIASEKISEKYGSAIKGFEEILPVAKELVDKYPDVIILPTDAAVERDGARVECSFEEMNGDPFYDIGSRTAEIFGSAIRGAKVAFANGPMGFFEKDQFKFGTIKVLEAIAECDCITVVGGGHVSAMAERMDLVDRITHISTGGGATMSFLTGKKLPLIEALENAARRMDQTA
ncbi:MAG: phosphoglycerate kinase [Candidatus Thorarchaeota archaeon]|nr:phosphoglycerate kinase [Candidatus Thorarchaeota archaeon]